MNPLDWLPIACLTAVYAALNAHDLRQRRAQRRTAARQRRTLLTEPPAPGQATSPAGHERPASDRAPAPGQPYGNLVITIAGPRGLSAEFYDTGIVIWRDTERHRRIIHVPALRDEDFERLLNGDTAP